MQKLLTLISNTQNALKKVGKSIDLPVIAVVGSQSAGKSSVLEAMIGLDLLPKRAGLCTRVPLELVLLHKPDVETAVGEFKHLSAGENAKFQTKSETENLAKIREEILRRTDSLTGPSEIKDAPIYLKVTSKKVPDLLLVDLPGVTKVSVATQSSDIVKRIVALVTRYTSQSNTIILAVTAANVGLANSDSLSLAREVDPTGARTVGVLTKLDLMDVGTDALPILRNETYPLALGYVAVVNRSQADLKQGLSLEAAHEREQHFFRNSAYKDFADASGAEFLAGKVSMLLQTKVRENIPDMKNGLHEQLKAVEEELASLGGADFASLDDLLLRKKISELIKEYCDRITNSIEGQYGFENSNMLRSRKPDKEVNKEAKKEIKSEPMPRSHRPSVSMRKDGMVKIKRDLIYHSRYLVHNNGTLTWYKSETNLAKPRSFSLAEYDVPSNSVDRSALMFTLASADTKIYVKVPSEKDLDGWIESIARGREFLKAAGKECFATAPKGTPKKPEAPEPESPKKKESRFSVSSIDLKKIGEHLEEISVEKAAGSKIRVMYLTKFVPEIEKTTVLEKIGYEKKVAETCGGANFFDGVLLNPFILKNLVYICVSSIRPICFQCLKDANNIMDELSETAVPQQLERYSGLKMLVVSEAKQFLETKFFAAHTEIEYLLVLHERFFNGCLKKLSSLPKNGSGQETATPFDYLKVYLDDFKIKVVDSVWKITMVCFILAYSNSLKEHLVENFLFMPLDKLRLNLDQDPELVNRMRKLQTVKTDLQEVIADLTYINV